ncbi:unnamed protein product [Pocillopora meandrina]|uniref:Uncharacterized protein n=1 Tax=Pocillopora meandrina TaxID=46732 RepID=A0AAU9XHT3_9CNID|nr:unnamed protein product [Pocillopora meandrina]
MIEELLNRQQELVTKNQRLRTEIEDKASQLYDAMVKHTLDGHKGRATEGVGRRQQQRHLKEIREKAHNALWFAETYGLEPRSPNLEDKAGRLIKITFASQHFPEKEKIRTILYIMDRFSLSLKGYHELTKAEKALPRTHLMERCARTLAQGAELPFKLLIDKEVGNFVKNNADGTIKVKVKNFRR